MIKSYFWFKIVTSGFLPRSNGFLLTFTWWLGGGGGGDETAGQSESPSGPAVSPLVNLDADMELLWLCFSSLLRTH